LSKKGPRNNQASDKQFAQYIYNEAINKSYGQTPVKSVTNQTWFIIPTEKEGPC